MQSPIRFLDLEQFVERSFDAYERFNRAEIRCDRAYSDRYREVFGKPSGLRSRVHVSPPSVPAQHHPYSDLPPERFWRKAIATRPAAEVDPVGATRFVFEPNTRIVTAGSCFAQNIARALIARGCVYQVTESSPNDLSAVESTRRNYGIYSARYGNLYTARQLVQLVARAYGDFVPTENAWRRPDGRWADPFRPEIEPDGFASIETLEADRVKHFSCVRRMLESAEVFVFTLGLTEAWMSSIDGAVFPLAPGVVAGQRTESHVFVNFNVNEVIADLELFVESMKRINPRMRLLLTVSPVPLAATFEDRHVLTSTIYSKSVLRTAAETLRTRHDHCEYFPAYEIVNGHYNRGAYYGPDLRSITRSGVDHVMRLFFEHYVPAAQLPKLDEELLDEAESINRLVCEEERLDQATPV